MEEIQHKMVDVLSCRCGKWFTRFHSLSLYLSTGLKFDVCVLCLAPHNNSWKTLARSEEAGIKMTKKDTFISNFNHIMLYRPS